MNWPEGRSEEQLTKS